MANFPGFRPGRMMNARSRICGIRGCCDTLSNRHRSLRPSTQHHANPLDFLSHHISLPTHLNHCIAMHMSCVFSRAYSPRCVSPFYYSHFHSSLAVSHFSEMPQNRVAWPLLRGLHIGRLRRRQQDHAPGVSGPHGSPDSGQ